MQVWDEMGRFVWCVRSTLKESLPPFQPQQQDDEAREVDNNRTDLGHVTTSVLEKDQQYYSVLESCWFCGCGPFAKAIYFTSHSPGQHPFFAEPVLKHDISARRHRKEYIVKKASPNYKLSYSHQAPPLP